MMHRGVLWPIEVNEMQLRVVTMKNTGGVFIFVMGWNTIQVSGLRIAIKNIYRLF